MANVGPPRRLGYYLRFSWRRGFLAVLAILCVVPGSFAHRLPPEVRSLFVLVFSTLMVASAWSQLLAYSAVARILPVIAPSRKSELESYLPPGLHDLAHTIGIRKLPKVFLTRDPRVHSPFTNALTGTIRVPKSWLAKFSGGEMLSTIGHELGHVRHRRRFWLEMLMGFALALLGGILLAFQTVTLIAQVFEVALLLLVIPVVSWRNERWADFASAKALGPEGLISVLEHLKAEATRDEGSETHPPLEDRIRSLENLLDSLPRAERNVREGER
jgi:Zn-dependent protease with chaperone function